MEKTKFGINPAFYAIIAFILAWMGDMIWIGLLMVFLIAAEQNEWAARQTIQALVLSVIIYCLFALVNVFSMDMYYDNQILMTISNIVNGGLEIIRVIIKILRLAICIFGIVKVSHGKEANIPLANKVANWAYGKVEAKKEA